MYHLLHLYALFFVCCAVNLDEVYEWIESHGCVTLHSSK